MPESTTMELLRSALSPFGKVLEAFIRKGRANALASFGSQRLAHSFQFHFGRYFGITPIETFWPIQHSVVSYQIFFPEKYKQNLKNTFLKKKLKQKIHI